MTAKFDELGVSSYQDLRDAYADDGIIKGIQASLDSTEFGKFRAAPAMTKFLLGESLSPLLIETISTASTSLVAVSSVASETARRDGEAQRQKMETDTRELDTEALPAELNWALLPKEIVHKYAMTQPASLAELCDAFFSKYDTAIVSTIPVVTQLLRPQLKNCLLMKSTSAK